MNGMVCLQSFNFWWKAVEAVTDLEPEPEILNGKRYRKKPAIGQKPQPEIEKPEPKIMKKKEPKIKKELAVEVTPLEPSTMLLALAILKTPREPDDPPCELLFEPLIFLKI